MAVTIKEVAKEAGVSTATVSHVLNETRFVSDDLIEKVNQAIENLGYYPNQLVRGLRSNKTYSIGLVLPSISNETFGLLAESLQKTLFARRYNLIICNTTYDQDIEKQALNTLIMKKVDAIIAIPCSSDKAKFLEICTLGIPLILIDRKIPGLEVDTIGFDNEKTTYDAIEYLINLGHKEIGYIDRLVEHSHSSDQKIGYKNALEAHGLVFDPNNIVCSEGLSYVDGNNAVKKLLRTNPKITAVFAYFDIAALGAIRGIVDLGFEVPGDVSVLGCDGMPFTDSIIPRLTTIYFPMQKVAEVTCNLINDILKDSDNHEIQEIVVDSQLLIRDSTAPPRSKRDLVIPG